MGFDSSKNRINQIVHILIYKTMGEDDHRRTPKSQFDAEKKNCGCKYKKVLITSQRQNDYLLICRHLYSSCIVNNDCRKKGNTNTCFIVGRRVDCCFRSLLLYLCCVVKNHFFPS